MTTKRPLPSTAQQSPSAEEPAVRRSTKHAELTALLRDLVTTLHPGDRLPAQEELMRQYKVSDRTVLRSLEDLQRAGWIVRRPGSGTYVTDPSERAASPSAEGTEPQTASQTITVLAPHFFATSYLRLCVDLLSDLAEVEGLSLVCHVARNYETPDTVRLAEALRPRGFVLLGYPFAETAHALIERGHRAVVVGTPPLDEDAIVPCVCADHEFGGYLAAHHLLEYGHRRIAFAFDGQMRYPYQRHPRWAGHQRAIAEVRRAGETVTDGIIPKEMMSVWRSDARVAAAYFQRPDAPTGIAVWNDSAAITLLGVLHWAGLRVPDDLSLIGFDALPEGAHSIPPLTTVDQHVSWQMQTVLRLLTRPTPPPAQAVVTLPELIQRSSCGPFLSPSPSSLLKGHL